MILRYICILVLVNIIHAKLGPRQDLVLSEDPQFVIVDFALIKGGDVLLVLQGWNDTNYLYVVDTSQEKMSVMFSTKVCSAGLYPWYPNKLIYNNDTSFYIQCQWIPDISHLYLNLSLAVWNDKSIEIKSSAYYLDGGDMFPTPPDSKFLWWIPGGPVSSIKFVDPNTARNNNLSRDPIGTKWGNVNTMIVNSSCQYFTQAGFVSTKNDFLVLNCYQDSNRLTYKVSIPDGNILAALDHNPIGPLADSYTVSNSDNSQVVQITESSDHRKSQLVKWDIINLQSGPNLDIAWPYWTVYDGANGFNGATFSGNYLFARFYLDDSSVADPERILQISLGKTLGEKMSLIDYVGFDYEYVHDIVAGDSYVYCDTDSTTISRWSFV